MKKSLLATLAVAALAITSLTAHAQKDPDVGGAPMYPTKTIVENAVDSPIHKTLVAAVKAGGLVDKVGLLDLDSNALYGALLSLRDGADDKEQIAKWTALGGRAFAREARLRDEGKEAVVLTFPAPLDKDITATLRQAGFRFSKVMQHWEGLARFDEAESLAEAYGGAARRVAATSAVPSSASVRSEAAE